MFESINISDEELAALPTGMAGFVAYEALCRDKLKEILSRYSHNDDDSEPRHSYLTKVFSAAEYYNVPILEDEGFEIHPDFDDVASRRLFQLIDREVTKLRLQTIPDRKALAVIEPVQATKIEHLVGQLRQRITDSDIDDGKKAKLYKKLDELLAVMKGKPTLQATMVVIASFFTAINQGEAAIIKLPDTISAIAEVFGHAQQDADKKLLEHKSQKLIEDHSDDYSSGFSTKPKPEAKQTGPRGSYDLNDDIPF